MSFLKPLIILSFLAGGLLAKKPSSFLPRSFEASFTKSEKSVLSGKLIKTEGDLFYQYPSRIRLEEKGKEQSLFISNPFTTYYYKPPVFEGLAGELTISKSSDHHLSNFFDSLKKGLNSNDLYEIKKEEKKVEFTFTKKGIKSLKILNAEMHFSSGISFSQIDRVDITLDNKKKVSFNLQRIKINPTFTKNFFDFDPPKNTRISR